MTYDEYQRLHGRWVNTGSPPLGLTRLERPRRYQAFYPPSPPKILTSVTTVLDVVAKPALNGWYGKQAAMWAVDNLALLAKLVGELGREAAIEAVAKRGEGERDRKAKIGTAAHGAVEALLLGQDPVLTPDTLPLFDQYQRFVSEWAFRPIWSEAAVCSERYGYAGTFDLYGKVAGRRALIDIKTGYVADTAGIQLAAYGNADYIGRPGTTDRWKVPEVDVYLVLKLQPDRYDLLPFDVTKAEVAAFLAAAHLLSWTRNEGRRIIGQPLRKGMLEVV